MRAAHAGTKTAATKVERANAALESARQDELAAWAKLYSIKGVEAPATAHMLLGIPMSEAELWFAKVRRSAQSQSRPKRPANRGTTLAGDSHLSAVGE